MNDAMVIQLLREAVMITMIVSAPIMLVGMLVGLVVAIFQTTTSIQEQTLTFVPKIVAICGVSIFFAAWMIHMMVNYTKNLFVMMAKIGAGG